MILFGGDQSKINVELTEKDKLIVYSVHWLKNIRKIVGTFMIVNICDSFICDYKTYNERGICGWFCTSSLNYSKDFLEDKEKFIVTLNNSIILSDEYVTLKEYAEIYELDYNYLIIDVRNGRYKTPIKNGKHWYIDKNEGPILWAIQLLSDWRYGIIFL